MTILWLIERLLVKPAEGSLTDVVITADWRCNGSQESFSGTCYGSCSFAPPSGSFTPYVTLQIANQINPPVVSLPLPWVPPVPVVVAEPATVVDALTV